jgi:hypothetical protein
MREALRELFAEPYFQDAATKEAQQHMVSSTISSFNKPARDILEARDPAYAANRNGYRAFEKLLNEGASKEDAAAEAFEFADDLGLPPPDLP